MKLKRLLLQVLLWSAIAGFVCLCFVFPLEWVLLGAAVFAVAAIVLAAAAGDEEDNIWRGFLIWLWNDYGDDY